MNGMTPPEKIRKDHLDTLAVSMLLVCCMRCCRVYAWAAYAQLQAVQEGRDERGLLG